MVLANLVRGLRARRPRPQDGARHAYPRRVVKSRFEKQTWIGKVVSKSCDTQAWCKYVGQKGLWSFPPADPALRVHRVSLPAVCQQGLSKTELRKRLRHAGVGSFVDLRFERGGALVFFCFLWVFLLLAVIMAEAD